MCVKEDNYAQLCQTNKVRCHRGGWYRGCDRWLNCAVVQTMNRKTKHVKIGILSTVTDGHILSLFVK